MVVGLSRYWTLPSWDKFRIPKPFSRALVLYGDPIHIPPEPERRGDGTLSTFARANHEKHVRKKLIYWCKRKINNMMGALTLHPSYRLHGFSCRMG